MNLKRIVSSHFANYREAWEANEPDRPRPDPPDPEPHLRAGGRRGRPRSTSTRTCTRARSACSRSRPRRASASPTRRSALASRVRSTGSATSDPAPPADRRHATRVCRGGGIVKVSRLWSPVTRWGDFRRRQLAALEESNRIAAQVHDADDRLAVAADRTDARPGGVRDQRGCRCHHLEGPTPRAPLRRPPRRRRRACPMAGHRLRPRRAAAQPALAVLHRLRRRHRRAARHRRCGASSAARDHAHPAHRLVLPDPGAQPDRRGARAPRDAPRRRGRRWCSPWCSSSSRCSAPGRPAGRRSRPPTSRRGPGLRRPTCWQPLRAGARRALRGHRLQDEVTARMTDSSS